MAADDKSNKTEKPTPKKRKEARRKGLAARSSELPQAVSLVATAIALPILVPRFIERTAGVWSAALAPATMAEKGTATGVFAVLIYEAIKVFIPLTLIAATSSTIAQLVLTGGRPNIHKIKPSFKHINPVSGIKRMVSTQIIWELGRNVVKIGAMGLLTWMLYKDVATTVLDGSHSLSNTLGTLTGSLRDLIGQAAALALFVGLADAAFNRRKFMGQIKMSKHEVREENKQAQVSPFVKNEMRRRQAQLSRSRMMAAIAGADVVVTNPTRLAIALKYEPGDVAPVVVAKGAGHIAKRIREEARKHGVPIRENKPLAQAMYRGVEIGQSVPAEFFAAVAAVLAAIYRARRRRVA
jgi:flagellar biosynthesis protein FlhB